jgi:hypothetical protein
MTRILIYTPTYDDMLRPETVASVESQKFSGELDYEIDDRNLHDGRSMLEVSEKYRDARQMGLDGGYDALLTVEHDMVLPDGCIQALWDTPAPVVYAAYMLRHGWHVINLFRAVDNRKSIGMSLSLYPRELRELRKLGCIEVSGAGFGCTLMRREALEKVPFRVLDAAPDLAFAGDCVRAGLRQMGRFDAACLHIDGETGEVISVDEAGELTRVEALHNVTVNVGGDSLVMKRNRYYTMPMADAKQWERASYVRISSDVEREVAVAPETDSIEVADAPVVRKRKPRKQKTMSTKSV